MKHCKAQPTWTNVPDPKDPFPRKAIAMMIRMARRHGKVFRIGKTRRYFLPHFSAIVESPRNPEPPPPFSLSMRLTHRYNAGWSDLDDWHTMGEARVVDMGKRQDEDHGESYRQTHIIEVKAPGYRPRNVMRALYETLRFGCRCEHDCCGHFFGGASRIRPLGKDRYAVLIRASMNV